jgi:phospholipid/cholesterol/gamma-HCH transport system permease protein
MTLSAKTTQPIDGLPLGRRIAGDALRTLGRSSLGLVDGLGAFAVFAARATWAVPRLRGARAGLARAVYEAGVRCLPVIFVVGGFTGLVLGLQGYYVLARFGSESVLGSLVALTLTRELAPVLAALMIVGQAGSALAAELGIQRNSEQIDALGVMGVDPLGYLVTPRLLAAIVVFPILTAAFTLIGIAGGYVSGSVLLSLDGGVYWAAVRAAVQPGDVGECLLKAAVFGVLTFTIGSYQGFYADRQNALAGARAVSAATTRAVVLASVAVLVSDFVITSLLA